HRKADRVRFELRPEGVDLPGSLGGEPGDERPLVRDDLDEVFVSEVPQRLAHRPPRDPERLAELDFMEGRPGGEMPSDDRFADVFGNGGGEGGGANEMARPVCHAKDCSTFYCPTIDTPLSERTRAREAPSISFMCSGAIPGSPATLRQVVSDGRTGSHVPANETALRPERGGLDDPRGDDNHGTAGGALARCGPHP